MKLFYEYIYFNLSPTSNHLHPLHVENCDSNSRLVVDKDDNGKFRLESVKGLADASHQIVLISVIPHHFKLWVATARHNLKW